MQKISIHPSVVLLIAAAAMLVAAIGGADFGRYRQWALVFDAGDIFLLSSNVGSPLGLPVFHWSPGPGLLFALPSVVLGGVADSTSAALVAGWLAMLLFWWAMVRVLAWATRGSFVLTALGMGALFLGTHTGFLTRSHASESLAIAFVALLVLSVVEPARGVVASSWMVGCSTALLIMTRSHYVVYATPALLLAAARILDLDFARPAATAGDRLGGDTVRDGRAASDDVAGNNADSDDAAGGGSGNGAITGRRLLAGLALLLPPAVAALQQAQLNRWMTGSMVSSPYVFGDSTFRSVDWFAPLFLPVLTHPWHGLLVYHPLYAVASAAAAICWTRAESPRERALWTGALVAVAVNLWIQAAWYAWWLGTGTYGMRGMAPAAVVLVPALARLLADASPAATSGRVVPPLRSSAWVAVTVGCCLWSFLMLRQGTSQFYELGDVLAGQTTAIARLSDGRFLAAALIASILVIGVWIWARRGGRMAGADVTAAVGAGILATLSLAYLLAAAQPRWLVAGARLFLPAVLLLVLLGVILAGVRVAGDLLRGDHRRAQGRGRRRAPARAAAATDPMARSMARVAVTVVFLAGSLLFARLALVTEERLATGDIPDRRYRYAESFDVQNALTGLREYQRIGGFEERKEALRAFLEARGARLQR